MNFGNTIKLNKCGSLVLLLLVLWFMFYAFRARRGYHYNDDDNVDLRRLLIGGIQAAMEGGRMVVSVYNTTHLNTRSKGKTLEGANNPVTDADMKSHCAMYYGLTRTFPQVKVISEEESPKSDCLPIHNLDLDPTVLQSSYELPEEYVPSKDVTVWIDPLDATQEFTERLIEYVTTMVCVSVNGVPVLGVIHFPFSGSTTWAWVGKNVPMNHHVPQKKVRVITSRSHRGDVNNLVKKALGDSVEIVPAGGAGYKSVQVAVENATAYIHTTHIKKWDICAGDALLRALRGKMTTLSGDEIFYGFDESKGREEQVVNKGGLLATLSGHNDLQEKLAAALLPP